MSSVQLQKPIRAGVIGCGHWGKNYVRMFSSFPGVVLAGVAENKLERQQTASGIAPGVELFPDYRDLLDPKRCDAVIISTPASTHYTIAAAALNAGLHVLVEKPFTLKTSDAEELIRSAESKKKTLMVAHTFLYNPSVRKVKQCIQDGTLGDLYYLKACRTHLGLIREDVSAMWDLVPHDISMLLYFLEEEPVNIQAMGRCLLKKGREDIAFISLEFPSGVIAHAEVSWADSNKERILDIVGSKARILFDDLNTLEPIRIFYKGVALDDSSDNYGEFKYLLRDGDIVSPKVETREPLKILCNEFIDCVRTGRRPLSDGEMGRKVVSVLCRIDDILRKQGKK